MCIKLISNYYHKKYHIPYIFFILVVIMSLTLIILNPYHAIANKYSVKIIFCIISICIIACVSRCLCFLIDESIKKKKKKYILQIIEVLIILVLSFLIILKMNCLPLTGQLILKAADLKIELN